MWTEAVVFMRSNKNTVVWQVQTGNRGVLGGTVTAPQNSAVRYSGCNGKNMKI